MTTFSDHKFKQFQFVGLSLELKMKKLLHHHHECFAKMFSNCARL